MSRKIRRHYHASVAIDGLRVLALNDEALAKVCDALQLIHQHDPLRYARIRRDLGSVWVTGLWGALGQYVQSDHTCELDTGFVERATPDEIALTIVHEATHARLWRRGIGYDEAIRPRVEAACLHGERAFASRLPAGGAEHLEPYLHTDLSPEAWSDATLTRRGLHGMVASARDVNMPRWLIGFFLRTRRSALRRRRRRAASKTASGDARTSAANAPASAQTN